MVLALSVGKAFNARLRNVRLLRTPPKTLHYMLTYWSVLLQTSNCALQHRIDPLEYAPFHVAGGADAHQSLPLTCPCCS